MYNCADFERMNDILAGTLPSEVASDMDVNAAWVFSGMSLLMLHWFVSPAG